MNGSIDEDPFRLVVQSIVDYAIYMLDPTGAVTSWNAGAERIKGYTADEIIGSHFSRFYTDEDREAEVPAGVLRTAEREGKFEGEGWRVRKDGSRFWASVVIDRIDDSKGNLLGFAKITRDMTDKRAAQQELLEAERRFRLLVQGVTDYAILPQPECVGERRHTTSASSDDRTAHFVRFGAIKLFDAVYAAVHLFIDRSIFGARRVNRCQTGGNQGIQRLADHQVASA